MTMTTAASTAPRGGFHVTRRSIASWLALGSAGMLAGCKNLPMGVSVGNASQSLNGAAQLKEAFLANADRFARPGKDVYRDQRNTPAMLEHARKVVNACKTQNIIDFKLAEVHEITNALADTVNTALAGVRSGAVTSLDAFTAQTFPQISHALVKFNELAVLEELASGPALRKGGATNKNVAAQRTSNGDLVIPPFSTVTYTAKGMCMNMLVSAPGAGDGMRMLHISQRVPEKYQAIFLDMCRLYEREPAQRRNAQRMVWVILHEPGQPKIDLKKWFSREFLIWVRDRHPKELEELVAKVDRNNRTKRKGNSYANSPFAARIRNRKKEQQAAARAERCSVIQRIRDPRDCEELSRGTGRPGGSLQRPVEDLDPENVTPEDIEEMLDDLSDPQTPQTPPPSGTGVTLLPQDICVAGKCTDKLTPELVWCNPTATDEVINLGEWCSEPMPGVNKQMVTPQGYRANAYERPAYKMWNDQQLRAADYLFQKFLGLIGSILGEPLLAKLKDGTKLVAINLAKSKLSPAMLSKLAKAAEMLPFIGNVIGAFEFFTGRNWMTLKPLTAAESIAAFVAMAPGGQLLKYAQKTLPTLMKAVPIPKAGLASTALEKSIAYLLSEDVADFTEETLGKDAALSKVLRYNQDPKELLAHDGFFNAFKQHKWSEEWDKFMEAYDDRFEEMYKYSKVL